MMITKIREGMSGKTVAEIIDGNFEYLENKQDIKFDEQNTYLDGKLSEYEEQLKEFAENKFVEVDEDDLTIDAGKAKFTDREYVADSNTGMGYKILRRRIYNNTNLLVQADFDSENTIYELRYDFDLAGLNITLPNNCILKFDGGTISNGTIGGVIDILDTNKKIFNNITFAPNSYIPSIKPEYFGAIANGTTDCYDAFTAMFTALETGLPKYNVNLQSKPDFTKVNIIFKGKYAISNTIILPTHYRLSINSLNIIALNNFQGDYLIRFDTDSFGLSFTDCVFDGALKASCLGFNAYSLDTTIQGCTFVKFKEFGINGYSDTANGHELKILNTKINQFEYQEFPSSSITTGIGLKLNSRRHDNNFNNLIINYCMELNYQLEGSANTFVNCHFYNKGQETFNISGQYTTFQSCYFDGVGTAIYGGTSIDNCFYSSTKDDASTVFIKLVNSNINWLHAFNLIRNNIFRNDSPNTDLYTSPISMDDGTSITSINYTFIDNRFFKVTEHRKQASEFKGTTVQTNTQRIFQDSKNAIRIGNLLIQFGFIEVKPTGAVSVTFDIPYNEKVMVLVTPYNSSSDTSKCYAYNVSNAGFTVSDTNFYWIAIGNKNI